jgi:hypothetical protein
MRRFAPLLLIGAVALFIFPLLNRSSSGLSGSEKANRAMRAMALIDAGEVRYAAGHGRRYTEHLADLLPLSKGLGASLSVGLLVQLDVSSDARTYLGRVQSENLSLVRARTGPKLTTSSCLVVKKAKGVACPKAKKKV